MLVSCNTEFSRSSILTKDCAGTSWKAWRNVVVFFSLPSMVPRAWDTMSAISSRVGVLLMR